MRTWLRGGGFINPSGPPDFWLLVSAIIQATALQRGTDVDTLSQLASAH